MAIDQQRLESEGVYETKAPIASVLADLQQLETILDGMAARKKSLGRAGALLIVAALLLFVLGRAFQGALMTVAAIATLIPGIVLVVLANKTGKGFLDHRSRCTVLKKLLETVRHDSDASAKSTVRLGLKGERQILRETPWAARKKGTQQFSKDRVLEIQSPLLDGTYFTEEIVELARTRKYVNPRGKSKTKVRNRYLVTLRFSYPVEIYGDVQRAQESLKEEVRVPPSAVVRGMRVTEKSVVVKAMVNLENEIAQASAMAALGAYRVLNLARRKKSAGGKA